MQVGKWNLPDLRILEYLRLINYIETEGSSYYFESRRRLLHDQFLKECGIERTSPEKIEFDNEIAKLYFEMYNKDKFFEPKTFYNPFR